VKAIHFPSNRQGGGDYLTMMINLLKQQGGVLFPGGKRLELESIRPLNLGYCMPKQKRSKMAIRSASPSALVPSMDPSRVFRQMMRFAQHAERALTSLSLLALPSKQRRRH